MVVIGGSFSGINTALELAEKGITNIVVLEGRHLGYGGTGRNGVAGDAVEGARALEYAGLGDQDAIDLRVIGRAVGGSPPQVGQ